MTFPNLQQNSANAFEIKYFYATNRGTSTGAITTGATTVGANSTKALVLLVM